jgi:hypothetical protein
VRLWFRWGVVEIRVGNEGSRCGRREVRSGKREDEDAAAGDKEEVVVGRVWGRRKEVLVLGEKIQSQGAATYFLEEIRRRKGSGF